MIEYVFEKNQLLFIWNILYNSEINYILYIYETKSKYEIKKYLFKMN